MNPRVGLVTLTILAAGCATGASRLRPPDYSVAIGAALKDPAASNALTACRDGWSSEAIQQKREALFRALGPLGYWSAGVTLLAEDGRPDQAQHSYTLVIDGSAYSGVPEGRATRVSVKGTELGLILDRLAQGYRLTGDERRAAYLQDGECIFITVRVAGRSQEAAFYGYVLTRGETAKSLEEHLVRSLGRFSGGE